MANTDAAISTDRGTGLGTLDILQDRARAGDEITLMISGRTARAQLLLQELTEDWHVVAVLFPILEASEDKPFPPRPADDNVVLDDIGAREDVPLSARLPDEMTPGRYRVCDTGSREGTVCDWLDIVKEEQS